MSKKEKRMEINVEPFGDFKEFLTNLFYGNNKAWDILIRQFGGRLRESLVSKGVEPADAEEVVQTVYLKLFKVFEENKKDPDDFDHATSLLNYMYLMAYHEFINKLRSVLPTLHYDENDHSLPLLLDDVLDPSEPEDPAWAARLDRVITRFLAGMKNKKHHDIACLYFKEFESVKDIAEKINERRDNVKKIIQRCRETIMTMIEQEAPDKSAVSAPRHGTQAKKEERG